MPTREWPTKAEHFRLDTIALAMDIKSLLIEQEYAQDAGDMVRVAYIRKQAWIKADRLQRRGQEARKQ